MPNHITTICSVTGPAADVAAFRDLMFVTSNPHGEDILSFEFTNIIPMPASVAAVTERGGIEEILVVLLRPTGVTQAWETLQKWKPEIGPWKGLFGFEKGEIERRIEDAFPGMIKLAREKCLAFGETGYWGWYDWSIANWGTKWGAYGLDMRSEDPLVFKFETAWDFPAPVFEALAARFPGLKFHCKTFDEGWNFAGIGFFNPGEGEPAWAKVEATDELYEAVYGELPERDEEDEEGSE
ncbi:hypothetical protein G6L37_35140 [Agrobacterium rubi]|nr:hypothetical protein [Agrobacterium rubi]NTF23806.1 hypothetical protein [Agrobacterium rubi]